VLDRVAVTKPVEETAYGRLTINPSATVQTLASLEAGACHLRLIVSAPPFHGDRMLIVPTIKLL
jgi:hypothetical protein